MSIKVRMVSSLSPYGGGVAQYTRMLTSSLEVHGVTVTVESDSPIEGHQEGTEWARGSWSRGYGFPIQLARALRRPPEYDVIHVQHEFALFGDFGSAVLFPALLAVCRMSGKPVVTTLHGVLPLSRDSMEALSQGLSFGLSLAMAAKAIRWITRTVVCLSTVVVVHDSYFRDMLVTEYGCSARKIVVIPHGAAVGPPSEDYLSARKALGLQGKFIIFHFGYLSPYKGLETLLDAFAQLAAEDRDCRLVIAGSTSLRHTEHGRPYLVALRERVPAETRDQVQFTGFIPDATLSMYLACADVVVFPYIFAIASSGALARAQTAGQAVILSDIPTFQHDTSDGSGLFHAGSVPSLLAKLLEIRRDGELRSRLRAASLHDAERRSWNRVSEQFVVLYGRLKESASRG